MTLGFILPFYRGLFASARCRWSSGPVMMPANVQTINQTHIQSGVDRRSAGITSAHPIAAAVLDTALSARMAGVFRTRW
jgi:hypothetical protein